MNITTIYITTSSTKKFHNQSDWSRVQIGYYYMGNQGSAFCESDSLSPAFSCFSTPQFDNLSILDCTESRPGTGIAASSGKRYAWNQKPPVRGLTPPVKKSLSFRVPEIQVGVEEGFKPNSSAVAVTGRRIGNKDLSASKHALVPDSFRSSVETMAPIEHPPFSSPIS